MKIDKVEAYLFASVLCVGFAYLYLVTFANIPESGIEHSKTIVGFMLGSVVGVLIGYRWGSSKGSADKSKTIEDKLQ